MNKQEIIYKIKTIEGLSQDDRSYLIDLINTKKRYGLVWENKTEEVEELLLQNLPVLKEVCDKRIIGSSISTRQDSEKFELFGNLRDKDSKKSPNHILIEGDNLHALTALSFTHENKIDVIYIDPPYNTKNKDFKYNDTFVDKEDAFRHSKWLSFMQKRLLIAKRLLSNQGVIFISIDDNEQSQLKLLCDEVFGESNFLQTIVWQKHAGGGNDSRYFAVDHEYIIAYSQSVENLQNFRIPLTDEEKKDYKFVDENFEKLGNYKTKSFKRMRPDDPRPGLQYVIKAPDGQDLFDEWKWEESKFLKAYSENRVLIRKNNKKEWAVEYKLYIKSMDDDEDEKQKVPRSLLTKIERNSEGKKQLSDLFDGKSVFNNPKPIELLQLFLNTKQSKNITILDFFAGSGTTLNATILQNNIDGGFRKCILITNNENNICEEVTYERNKRVICGYKNLKGESVPGILNNNLRYFKTEFVPSVKSETNKRLLTESSADLLCIKEDCYIDITKINDFNPKQCRIFTNDDDKILIIVFYSRSQMQVCEQLIAFIKTVTSSEKIRLYGFSPEKETLNEDFLEVKDKIDALPLPDAIYQAYRSTFRAIKLDKIQIKSSVENNIISEPFLLNNNPKEA